MSRPSRLLCGLVAAAACLCLCTGHQNTPPPGMGQPQQVVHHGQHAQKVQQQQHAQQPQPHQQPQQQQQQRQQQQQQPQQQQQQRQQQQAEQAHAQQAHQENVPAPPVQHQQQHQQQQGQQQQGQQRFGAQHEVTDEQHIKSHLDGKIDTKKELSEEQMQFHYFKMHDLNNDGRLDGIELIKAITHFHPDDEAQQKERQTQHHRAGPPAIPETDLEDMIDSILKEDDFNGDGYIEFAEFMQAQKQRHPPAPVQH